MGTDAPLALAAAHGAVSRRRPWWCALLLAVALAVGLAYWLPTARTYYNEPQPAQTGQSVPNYDFFQYYAAGHNWRLGFDPYTNHHSGGAIYHPRSERQSGYIYPPTLLPLYGWLSAQSYDTARAIWLAINVAVFLASVLAAALVSRGRRLEVLALAAFLIAISHPVLFAIRQGQADMLVAGLAVTGFLLYRRGNGWLGAAVLAVAVLTKTAPLFLAAMMLAYYRDWRFGLKIVCCLAALAGISLIALSGLYVEYMARVLFGVAQGNSWEMNQSIMRLWAEAAPGLVGIISLAAWAIAVIAVWVFGRRRVAGESGGDPIGQADAAFLMLAIALMLLLSPLAWHMWFVWTIVPASLLLSYELRDGWSLRGALVACGTLLMSAPIFVFTPVADSLNLLGAAIAVAVLLLLYPELTGMRMHARDRSLPPLNVE